MHDELPTNGPSVKPVLYRVVTWLELSWCDGSASRMHCACDGTCLPCQRKSLNEEYALYGFECLCMPRAILLPLAARTWNLDYINSTVVHVLWKSFGKHAPGTEIIGCPFRHPPFCHRMRHLGRSQWSGLPEAHQILYLRMWWGNNMAEVEKGKTTRFLNYPGEI